MKPSSDNEETGYLRGSILSLLVWKVESDRAVSRFIEAVNLPVASKSNSKNENVVPSSACMLYVSFSAIEHLKPVPTYPQPANPNGENKNLLQLKKFNSDLPCSMQQPRATSAYCSLN